MSSTLIIEKPNTADIVRQVLLWVLVVVVLVPTLLVWVGVISTFFGYRVVDSWGTSMEPVFRNGDALWVKQIDAHDIKVGDIVTLMPPGEESITHRVVKIEPVCNHCDNYFLTTKGDANNFTEDWEVTSDWTLALVVVHIPYAGYVFDFCTSIGGRLILLGLTATLFVIYVRRRQIAHGSNKPVSAQ